MMFFFSCRKISFVHYKRQTVFHVILIFVKNVSHFKNKTLMGATLNRVFYIKNFFAVFLKLLKRLEKKPLKV